MPQPPLEPGHIGLRLNTDGTIALRVESGRVDLDFVMGLDAAEQFHEAFGAAIDRARLLHLLN